MMKILSTLCLLSIMIPSASASEIEGMRVWTGPDNTRAVFDLSQSTEYKLFELDNPPRVVIDFENISLNKKLSIKNNKDIKNVRFSTKAGKQVRVVLDLKQKLKPKSFLLKPTGNYGHRLVVDLSHDVKTKPKVVSQISKPNRDVIIALDAGHGGEDPGAIGPKGTKEKVVTLNIANKLAHLIDQQKGMKALIIRNGDYYIRHRKRFEKARENQADLFISIHADAFHDSAVHGASVYILSKKGASSEAAKWLAEEENKSDSIGGVIIEDKQDMLSQVLYDLSQNSAMEESHKAAQAVHRSMKKVVKLHGRGFEKANFLVLKSPDVPSILIESGYISNPNDEKNLKSDRHITKLATQITAGIRDYFYQSPPPNTWIAAQAKAKKHVVKIGDTLSTIASLHQTNINTIKSINNKSTSSIMIGEVLFLPTQ